MPHLPPHRLLVSERATFPPPPPQRSRIHGVPLPGHAPCLLVHPGVVGERAASLRLLGHTVACRLQAKTCNVITGQAIDRQHVIRILRALVVFKWGRSILQLGGGHEVPHAGCLIARCPSMAMQDSESEKDHLCGLLCP